MSPAESPPRTRLATLDLTKGWLVVLMVLYHTFNYSTQYELGFRYLAFLPPSFILITGMMLTQVYAPRYSRGEAVDRRLLVRGAKLVLLFTALNVALRLTLSSAHSGGLLRASVWDEVVSVFVVGNGYGVAFDVLLPIGYVLLLAPAIVRLNVAGSMVLPVCATAVACAVTWLEWRYGSYTNLSLVSVGVAGALLGRAPVADDMERSAAAPLAIISALVCVVTTARAADTTLAYLVQSAAAISAVAALSFGSRAVHVPAWVSSPVALLGRYSLLSYILQIAVLHALATAWGRPVPGSIEFATLFTATLMLTLAATAVVEWLRPRARWVDGMYRAVFA